MDVRDKVVEIATEKGYQCEGKMVRDLSFYKKEVNLVALAASYGYTINSRKTGRGVDGHHKYIVMDGSRNELGHASNSDQGATSSERILISKNQVGMFQFNSVNNTDNYSKGSVFDFLMYHNPDHKLKDCISELNEFIVSPKAKYDLSLNFDNTRITEKDRDKEISSYNNIEKLHDVSFLEQRGLSRETIFSEEFGKAIYNSKFTNSETGCTYTNIAFPLVSDTCIAGYEIAGGNEKVTGFDVRNTGIKSTIDDKSSALWKSYADFKRPVPKAVFSESPVDSMSYHELKCQKGKNNQYLSSCGSLTDSQIGLLIKFFSSENAVIKKAFKDTEFVIATDKDLAGGYFANKILSQVDSNLLGSGVAPSLPVAFGVSSEVQKAHSLMKNSIFFPSMTPQSNTGRVSIIVPTEGENQAKFISKYLSNAFRVLNDRHAYAYSDNEPFNVSANIPSKDSLRFEVNFRNDKNQWGILNNFLLQHKFGKDSRLKIEQPILKDYNEDIKGAKGLNPDLSNRFEKNNGQSKYSTFFNPVGKLDERDARLRL